MTTRESSDGPREGANEDPGGRDLARTMELLWRVALPARRGPSPALTIEGILEAAVAIADADGLDGLSMRRVAERIGVGTMSLYRYVAGRAELLDLMVDAASGEVHEALDIDEAEEAAGWRARLEHVARENVRLYRRHPWLLEVFPDRPPMGPGVLGKYEAELRSLEGSGLGDVEMDLALGLVLSYARGAATEIVTGSRLVERTGLTDQAWWNALAPTLEKVFTPERYPLATRVGEAASAHHGGVYDPELAFEFGLPRVLDGIGAFIQASAR